MIYLIKYVLNDIIRIFRLSGMEVRLVILGAVLMSLGSFTDNFSYTAREFWCIGKVQIKVVNHNEMQTEFGSEDKLISISAQRKAYIRFTRTKLCSVDSL
jgi:hypothetical protein